jgi:hypothetical protein
VLRRMLPSGDVALIISFGPRYELIDLFRAIKADCQRFGLKPPNYNTVHARLLSLDPKEVGLVQLIF